MTSQHLNTEDDEENEECTLSEVFNGLFPLPLAKLHDVNMKCINLLMVSDNMVISNLLGKCFLKIDSTQCWRIFFR